jgi:hypothetical protein
MTRLLPALIRISFALAALLVAAGWWGSPGAANAGTEAQEVEPIMLTARAGFDGYYKDGMWVPVRITVGNDGPDVNAVLRVASPRYSGGEITIVRPISLPSQSRKEVFLYISPEGYHSGLKVSLVNDGDVLATTTARLAQAGPGDLVYGIMASSPSAFNSLQQVDPVSGQGFIAEITPDDLPPVAQAWKALDVLVVSDVDTGSLSAEQRLALAGWVAGGGRLFVAGGPGWQKTTAGLGDLLPARISGVRTLDSLAALYGYTHTLEGLDGSAIVAVAEPAPGASVALAAGDPERTPLVITKKAGFGLMVFLAFDPALAPLRRWDGSEGIYRNLLSATTARPGWSGGFRNWYSASEALNAIPGLELPNAIQLCGFLAVYVVAVGPVNFLVLHRLKRRELAWLTIPAIIVVFSGLAYLGGYRLRGTQATLHRLSVVQVWPSSDRAQVDMLIGLFSPRRTEYDLEIGGESLARPLPADSYGGTTSAAEATLEQEGVTRIHDLRVEIGGVEAFVAQGHVTAPPIHSTLTLSVQGNSASLDGRIENDSDLTFTDTVLLAPGGVQRFGDFAPGQVLHVNMPLASGRAAPAAQGNAAIVLPAGAATATLPNPSYNYYSGYDTTIDDILGSTYYYDDRKLYRKYSLLSALIDQYSGAGRGSGVYLVGWTAQAPLQAEITDTAFTPVDATAYIVELRPEVIVSGGRISIPPGLMSWTILDPGQQGTVTPYDLYVYQGHFSMRFTPSQALDFRQVASLDLHLSAYGQTGPISGLEVALWDFVEGEWIEQTGLQWGDNHIPEPARLVGSNGEIQVRVSNPSSVSSISIEAVDFTLVVER